MIRFASVVRPLALVALSVSLIGAAPAARPPLYKDPHQPVAKRVEDLLHRMTLAEKVAQMQAVWEHKDLIQTPAGEFSAEKAEKAFPDGLGEISRPSDRRGVPDPVLGPGAGGEGGAAGAADHVVNRNARETALYTNAAQHWAVEHTRLGIPLLMHEEGLHGYVAKDATSF